MIDADGSGEVDAEEVAELYQKARGEKLKSKDLKKAMAEMDTDQSGTVEFDEFETWWSASVSGAPEVSVLAYKAFHCCIGKVVSALGHTVTIDVGKSWCRLALGEAPCCGCVNVPKWNKPS